MVFDSVVVHIYKIEYIETFTALTTFAFWI